MRTVGLLIVAVLLALAAGMLWQIAKSGVLTPHPIQQANNDTPTMCSADFEDYPAETYFTGEPRAIDYTSAEGSETFKTAIEHAVSEGVTFAGSYAVATIGCGTGCQASYIINLERGIIIGPAVPSIRGVEFQKDSRLFIINPYSGQGFVTDTSVTPGYYFLAEESLVPVCPEETSPQDSGETLCIQVITEARKTETGEIKEFPTPCDVPEGWEPVSINGPIFDEDLQVQ